MRRPALALAAALALTPPAPAATPPAGRVAPRGPLPTGAAEADDGALDEGAVAGAGRWTTFGGCAARTRATRTPAVRGPLAVAWRHAPERGALEGEPVLWGGRVVVAERRGPRRRALVALDLVDGERLATRELATDLPLEPGLWGDVVLVRAAPRELRALRLPAGGAGPAHARGGGFETLWSAEPGGEIGPPLLVGNEVYACAGGALVRLEVGVEGPAWTAPGDFRGRPSLRGEVVFALDLDRAGNAFLARLDRRTGRLLTRSPVGHHGGRRPGRDAGGYAAVMDDVVLLYPDLPLAVGSRSTPSLGLPRPPGDARTLTLESSTLDHRTPAARWGAAWLTLYAHPERGPAWIRSDTDGLPGPHEPAPGAALAGGIGVGAVAVLAQADAHGELCERATPPAVGRDAGYLGGVVFDLEDLAIRARVPGAEAGLLIPAREALLAVTPGELVAWRAADAGADPAVAGLAAPAPGERCAGATLVLRDGSVRTGDVRWGRGGARIGDEALDLARVDLVLDADGAARLAAGERALLRGCDALVERALAQGYAGLADGARACGDAALVRRLARRALDHGADAAALERVARALRGPAGDVDPAAIERALAGERRAREVAADVPWRVLAALPEPVRPALEHELLRRALRVEPAHAGAVARVRAALPWTVAPAERIDALDWIDFLAAAARHPVRRVEPGRAGARSRGEAERALARARAAWRDDLVAFESEHLVLVTPLARPGGIARCLATGELTCRALEAFFAEEPAGRRRAPRTTRLVVHLFGPEAEYRAAGHAVDAGEQAGLAWSAGHYDPEDDVSRVLLPDEPDAWSAVLRTVAHELAHHWMQRRCPLVSDADLRGQDPGAPGYWVVEGFAALFEEHGFDLDAGTWRGRDPRAARLDVLVHAPAERLLPWAEVLAWSQRDFLGLRSEGEVTVPSTWTLGRRRRLDARRLFYDQAAGVCRALFHGDAADRAALRRYLADHYAGRRGGLDVERALGASAEELGARAVACAARIQRR